jgi:FAD binding domain/Berberine and berberine like
LAIAVLDKAALAAIRGRFEGDVLEDGDAGYDDARALFNALIDRKPQLIVRAAGQADVVAAVRLARETQLPFAIKSGGHGVNGHASCDDGIVLDLSPMKKIVVDPGARTITAEAGVNWGEFDAATQKHGLATTGGRVTTTGIAGLTLGTGSGWLERLHGYTADNLISADVVTASGEIVRASEDENADLFWGLRGGGGNFGVVTSFEYRLHELPPLVLGGMLLWPFERAGDVIRFYREFIEDAPDEISGAAAMLTAPPAPFVPAELQEQHVVGVIAIAFADPERGEELLRPLREFGPPTVDIVGPMPYTGVQQLLDPGNPPGLYNYWKAELVPELSDELIDLSIAHANGMGRSHSIMLFQPLGGEIARIPDDTNAITARHAPWTAHCIGEWETPDETDAELAWVKAWGPMIEPFKLAGAPLTFRADTGDEHVRTSFGGKYARLVALKDKYDPENLFRLNQNIKPSGVSAAPHVPPGEARLRPS